MADPAPSTFVQIVITVEQLDGTVVATGSSPSTDLSEIDYSPAVDSNQ